MSSKLPLCQQCNKNPIKKGAKKYCSFECNILGRTGKKQKNPRPRNDIKVNCGNCGKKLLRGLWQIKKHKYFACSSHCKGKANFKLNKKDVLKSAKKAQEAIRGTTAWNKGVPNIHAMGEKSHLWKGGVTPKHAKIRHSIEYKEWRDAVFKRDDYTCQKCDKRGIYLEAHHKKSFSKHPKLRYEIDNGISYCKLCHAAIDKHRRRFIKKSIKQKILVQLNHRGVSGDLIMP